MATCSFEGIKFFEESVCLFRDGATITATSNNTNAKVVLTNDRRLRWESIGSDDTTTETLEITFSGSETINRIYLAGNNFLSYNIKYDNAGWVTITPTTSFNEEGVIYYEFADITTTKLQINCTTTQVADEEKTLTTALAMAEVGQFNLFPDIKSVKIDRNETKKKTLNEKYLVQKGFKTRAFSIGFPAYSEQDDLELMTSLFEREEPFYVWLCGGKYGATYFKPIIEPFTLDDMITMQTRDSLSNKYKNNYYKGGINTTLKLVEVVG